MKCLKFAILFAIVVCSKAEVKLPKYIIPCKAKDGLCLKNLLEGLAPRLKQGIREFNLPTIDPVDLPDCNITDYSLEEMPYTGLAKSPQFRGASNFEISKFDVDLDGPTLKLSVFFPQLIMRSYEVVWIKGFGFEVNGEGFATEYYNKVTINFSLNGEKYAGKENEQHIKWTEDLISVSMTGGAVFDVEPSFTDARNYQGLLNKASRDHPEILYPEVELYIKKTLGVFILKTLNTVHEIFPVDVLYLPDQINVF